MHSIDLECPNCGRVGTVPRDKVQSRLVCKKCHLVFHMSSTGRAVRGEPPPNHGKDDRHGANGAQVATKKWEVELPEITSVHLLAMGGIILVAGAIYSYMIWGGAGDNLEPRAQAVVDAIAHGDLASLKSAASSDTVDDVIRFYEHAHQKLSELRDRSGSQELLAEMLVVGIDRGTAETKGFFTPAVLKADTKSSSASAGTLKTVDSSAVDVSFYWTKRRGRWWLDGKKSLNPSGMPMN